MVSTTIQQQHQKLIALYQQYTQAYYGDGQSSISDEEFDRLKAQIQTLEQQFPELAASHSVLDEVGHSRETPFALVQHTVPMLSLQSINANKKELQEWYQKKVQPEKYTMVADLKIDGLAIALRYQANQLQYALTRGNGELGENIVHNVSRMPSLPKQPNFTTNTEIRGEIYFPREKFYAYNQWRQQQQLAPYKNPRNAAAGIARMKNPDSQQIALLNILVYDWVVAPPHDSHFANMRQLQKMGFQTNDRIFASPDIEQIFSFCDSIEESREQLPFDIDGVVIKLDSLQARKKTGYRSNSPVWAVAWKFSSLRASTKLLAVESSVSRNGTITPVAVVEPLLLAGSTIQRATLYNYRHFESLSLCQGDKVFIEKKGDVIPKIVAVDYASRKNFVPLQTPWICPSCETGLNWSKNKVDLLCPNEHCNAAAIQKIIHFVSKSGMDIDCLGQTRVQEFYQYGWLRQIPDIYRLKEHREELLQKPGWSTLSVEQLLAAIEKSKQQKLSKLLTAVGIPNLGKVVAQAIAKKVTHIADFLSLSLDELKTIENIGDIGAKEILDWKSNAKNQQLIKQLQNFGLNMTGETATANQGNVVLTGQLTKPRNYWVDLLTQNGYKVTSQVSKQTNYLVIGEKPSGEKIKKAQKLGIVCLNESEITDRLLKNTAQPTMNEAPSQDPTTNATT